MLTREILQSRYFKKYVPGDSARDWMKSKDPKTYLKYVKLVAENAKIVSDYPFYLPHGYDGKISSNFDFTYTEVDMVYDGWTNLLFKLGDEIKAQAIKEGIDPADLYVLEIKEKYGSLRMWLNNTTEEMEKILDKYERISEETCICCGDKATLQSTGWICPYCQECADMAKANREDYEMKFVPLEKSVWYPSGEEQAKKTRTANEIQENSKKQ